MESGLECQICMERYNLKDRRPKTLRCGHSLCLLCLEGWSKRMRRIECPCCQEIFYEQVDQIPDNQAILDILSDFEMHCPRHSNVEVEAYCVGHMVSGPFSGPPMPVLPAPSQAVPSGMVQPLPDQQRSNIERPLPSSLSVLLRMVQPLLPDLQRINIEGLSMSESLAVNSIVERLPFSDPLKQLLRKALAYDVEQRPSVQDIQTALSAVPLASGPLALTDYEIGSPIVPFNAYTWVDVHSGKCIATNEAVVIKTYTCESLKNTFQPLKEGLIQASFQHPNVGRLLDMCLSGSDRYHVHLVMEKLERNLLQEIKLRTQENRPYSETDMKAFLAQICSALLYGKKRRIAHRDIKPENILLDSSGAYKLCDFGTAEGTLPYMSKQVRLTYLGEDCPYDPFKADIYSLGMTALYLGALERPFRPREDGCGFVNLANEVIGRLHFSSGLKELLQSMLSDDEQQRPDIEAILSALKSK